MVTVNGDTVKAVGSLDEITRDLLKVTHSVTRTLYMNVAPEDKDALLIGLCNVLTDAVMEAPNNDTIESEHYDVTITETEG